MSLATILCIGFGGCIGAILRAVTNSLVVRLVPNLAFPLGTLIVNVIGGFLIGFILTITQTYTINAGLKSFLVTGILGGLTTFSTFTYESLVLLQTTNYITAALNITLNVAICLLFCYFGSNLAKIF